LHLSDFRKDISKHSSSHLHDHLDFVTFKLLKQIATQQATDVGVTDETLHFTEES